MLRVTFTYESKLLRKTFQFTEVHESEDNARLRALAMGWTITKKEPATRHETVDGVKWT